jgi:two-component system cell cycle sensor histidine kinase/response regulator CckA
MDKKTKILIVEDERIVAEDIKKSLSKFGYLVTALVSSGTKALREVQSNRPDLVLMDIVLQGKLNGIDTARMLHFQYDIPVIYLTAYADEDTLSKAKFSEPSGYILKPFENKELHSAIEMALYKYQTEKKLKESEAWLSTILQSIADSVIVTNERLVITFINHTAECLTGWKHKDAIGISLDSLFKVKEEKTQKFVLYSKLIEENESGKKKQTHALVLIDKSGMAIPIDDRVAPIYNDKKQIIGFVLIFHDIRDRKKAEQERENIQNQLHHAQKMEAIGLLAGGIAHDFNNLLTVIQGNNNLAMQKIKKEDSLQQDLNEIDIAAERAADLTRQLLLFSRKQPMKFVLLQINQVIEDMRNMLRLLIGEGVIIQIDLASDLWQVRADKGTIEQIIMNLAVNSRDALPNGGRLTIRTENSILDKNICKNHPDAQPGNFVRLTVQDDGIGMDTDIIDHIFDPFFSTKGEGKGTGLGLSVVYGIVKQHHGWIDVQSEKSHGTTFQIYLPASLLKSSKTGKSAAPLHRYQGNGKRIFVIEDDDGVRKFTKMALSENGYSVFEASTWDEAQDIFKKQNGSFDLVLSDVVLYQKSGLELVEMFKNKNPKMKFLLSSGYNGTRSKWTDIQKKGYPFIPKPYGLNELLHAVKEVVG